MTNRRNMQLEGLRGIAMLFVVLYHYLSGFPKHYYQPLQHNWFAIELWGYFGVSIFILISGYYMQNGKKVNPVSFTLKKVFRLWPVYVVAVTICFLLTRIVPLPERTVTTSSYLLNIPFINGFIGVDYVDGAHWYLTTLIACTFISAMISRIDTKKQWSLMVAWAILILFFDRVDIENRVLYLMLNGLFKVFGERYAPMFIAGLALRRLEEEKGYGNLLTIITAHLVNSLVLGWQREIAFLAATGLFLFANASKLPFLKAKFFTWMGLISYSVYVIHQNVGFWCMYLFSEMREGYTPGISVVGAALAIGVGALLYYTVEKPCDRLIRKIKS